MNRPISSSTLALAAVAWALLAARCPAQVGHQANSLDWLVADSDFVVRARVTSVERTPIPNPDPRFSETPRVWKVVTLRVVETIKGDRADSFTFAERGWESDRIYDGWMNAGREHLWFLVRRERREGDALPKEIAARVRVASYDGSWTTIRLGPPVPEERLFKPPDPGIFLANLDVVREPAAILDAARASAREGLEAGRVEGHGLELPRTVMGRSGTSGDFNSLTVPGDRGLETLARRLIGSPNDFLDGRERGEADHLRLAGVKALARFRSDQNAALLKPLLKDPYWSIHVDPDGVPEKVYDLREAAFRTLRSWDIRVDRPITREAPPKD